MVTNEAGQTALKYRLPVPVIAKNTPSQTEYRFTVKANLSIAWINQEDIDNLINRKKTCCGGTTHKLFRYASEDEARRWQNGGGR